MFYKPLQFFLENIPFSTPKMKSLRTEITTELLESPYLNKILTPYFDTVMLVVVVVMVLLQNTFFY